MRVSVHLKPPITLLMESAVPARTTRNAQESGEIVAATTACVAQGRISALLKIVTMEHVSRRQGRRKLFYGHSGRRQMGAVVGLTAIPAVSFTETVVARTTNAVGP